ncbi:MAG: 5-methyltetrahydropteroyltriglutamate--homocysteine S-methyltransferase [Candidatus Pristimantibacillus lignocellulolyticus]|uniref:5-methyltetrahydropteroyltriglutamate--homocysteine methyltransferase n=1 Tax=Candidatus Pristimantibacillus lignocellulolyticus TaxID=2994561 RepID=A0A9J6Z9T3_9BACL|nr:MAG: 5-methyltetrahydropteroyltriglutamate--homocysteine S-methyltransferase [Candidatus Pristimantibacillus lignocellulolyticus]
MVKSSILGYPRIGEQRQWKKALESFWNEQINEQQLLSQLQEIRLQHLSKQKETGIDLIPVNDFSLYDQVLDTSTMLGLIPQRFNYKGGEVSTQLYYEIARGSKDATASEMTKWFNTNYHYIVPELGNIEPQLTVNRPLIAYQEAKKHLNIESKPVLLGLFTFVKLSKGYKADQFKTWIEKLLPLYIQILQQLEQAGVQWVQVDEPAFVQQLSDEDLATIQNIYNVLAQAAPKLQIMLQTYFESVERYEEIVQLPVAGIGLDFVHGAKQNLQHIKQFGFPANKVLGAGVIDGRNIWKANLSEQHQLLQLLKEQVGDEQLWVQSSCSLLHVPVSLNREDTLPEVIRNVMAYADEKLVEIVQLTQAINCVDIGYLTQIEQDKVAFALFNNLEQRNQQQVYATIDDLKKTGLQRAVPFVNRYDEQQQKLELPILPTTTIGSFPQSLEVRQARQLWRKGEWNEERYNAFIEAEIDRWITIQEQLGLDVLVHGEFERTDMVEFFGEKLGGFVFTKNGWVQSYGSRCVKPPVIYGDVTFIKPMTLKETVYAQEQTEKPVKGMLTGPITIMNWSFVRQDIAREEIAYQLAYALRQEVEALEAAGIPIIQVDEPAVREGLPLKSTEQQAYLDWSIRAFRMTTCSVQATTQIHTHMCYCDFHDMIASIESMDADVISIETSRSHGELIGSFEENTYPQGIGLGVYDIHSPRVPAVAEMTTMIDRALQVLSPKIFWINPDCGLKTRKEVETIDALRNMVTATIEAREKLQLQTIN